MKDMAESIPVGSYYLAEQGDGMSSIAVRCGHFWQTIWKHPNNADLRTMRREPEVLLVGDRIYIPERMTKSCFAETGAKHRYRRKGVPAQVRFRVRDIRGRPLAERPYELRIGNDLYGGQTDNDGRLQEWVAPTERMGTLTVFNDHPAYPAQIVWLLKIGDLDPIDTLSGVRGRLKNLGFECDGEEMEDAILAFQRAYSLIETGVMDEATRGELRAAHGY